jgi:23S rRNA (uridine2552-2'-O)-methyltransferase
MLLRREGQGSRAKEMNKKERWTDHYTRRARKERWLARSVYKLEEIDRKYTIIRTGYRVLDLGCYPGSWSQYCTEKVGETGEVVGLDLKAPHHFTAPNFRFIHADIFTLDVGCLTQKIGQRDAVISGLSPQTTGIRATDTSRSMALVKKALELAVVILKKKGHFLCKVFEGEELKNFKDDCSRSFELIHLIRPSSVRKGSREIYLLGLQLVR